MPPLREHARDGVGRTPLLPSAPLYVARARGIVQEISLYDRAARVFPDGFRPRRGESYRATSSIVYEHCCRRGITGANTIPASISRAVDSGLAIRFSVSDSSRTIYMLDRSFPPPPRTISLRDEKTRMGERAREKEKRRRGGGGGNLAYRRAPLEKNVDRSRARIDSSLVSGQFGRVTRAR